MSKTFDLPEELTIYSAVETRDALLAWVSEQTAKSTKLLEISAANVREVDGAGLQLLASLSHNDYPWKLIQPSQSLLDACTTMGMGKWLTEQTANV